MADWTPIAHSPISGSLVLPTVTLIDESHLAKVTVRTASHGVVAAALPPLGRVERTADELRIGSGPGEWILLSGGIGARWAAVLEGLIGTEVSGEFTSIVDISHGRALLRLSGSDAPRVLAKVCAIDLRDSKVPDGSALRTSVAGITTDIIRDDDKGPSYLLHCERSSGQSLFDSLATAAAEFSGEPR